MIAIPTLTLFPSKHVLSPIETPRGHVLDLYFGCQDTLRTCTAPGSTSLAAPVVASPDLRSMDEFCSQAVALRMTGKTESLTGTLAALIIIGNGVLIGKTMSFPSNS